VAVEVAGGEGLVRRQPSRARRAVGSRDPLIGACLLVVAFVAAFGIRAATGAHAGSPVRPAFVGTAVQAPVNVATTNQIPVAPPLQLPKVVRHPARRIASPHRAAVHVRHAAVVAAPVTHPSVTPTTSTGGPSGSPTVTSGPTGTSGSGTGDVSVGAPSTSQGAPSGSHGSGTSAGGGTSSGTSNGGAGSSNAGTLSGGG
jgi:hypothetical protein